MVRFLSSKPLLSSKLTLVALLIATTAQAADFTVSNELDFGAGSLRDAILLANSQAGSDRIAFAIPGSNLPKKIALQSPLPPITESLEIDGTTQDPASQTPSIELDGSGAGSGNGLEIQASGCTVRGLIINSFAGSGITVASSNGTTSGTSIFFSWIGLDASGNSAAANGAHGISLVDSVGAVIGGTTQSLRNVISGNQFSGVNISGSNGDDNRVLGNYIGLDRSGLNLVTNGTGGGIIVSSPNTTIGVPNFGLGNVIAGSSFAALIRLDTSGNTVIGNFIGTNANGDATLGSGIANVIDGISVFGSNNIIGSPNAGNLVSGVFFGISLNTSFGPVTGNTIGSNLIGTNALQTAALPNQIGVSLSSFGNNALSGNTIGGPGNGNVISGNGTGLQLTGDTTTNNTIDGNFIGSTSGATPSALANTGIGIITTLGTSANTIGGSAGNTIAFNGGAGIFMLAGTANRISRNRIYSNAGIGIDLRDSTGQATTSSSTSGSGVTLNDPGDADSGANELQNFPEISVSVPKPGQVRVQGSLDSTPSSSFTLELFKSAQSDPSGFGEGQEFIGSFPISTGVTGRAPIDVTANATLLSGETISATVTNSNGSTSEFSRSVSEPVQVKPGARIEAPPIVNVVEDDVTVTLQVFTLKKKGSRSRRALMEALAAAKKSGKPALKGTIQYQVTIKNTASNKIQRQTSKKNVVTFNNLAPGSYTATYNVRVVQKGKVQAKTKESPSTAFTVAAATS